jgi:hypothetical protein
VQLRGFYVTRIVSAADPTDAGSTAIQLLLGEPKYQRLAGAFVGGAPELAVEEVSAAPESHARTVNRSGYIFFEDE